ncbi:MAG TPA: hypothetical protein ENI23_14115 [bacterium]|nr:hypothetical protein [bacterium]
MKNICEKCKVGKMAKYILQAKAPDGEYFAPRLMKKCKNCAYTIFVQKLPRVDHKIEGAVESY